MLDAPGRAFIPRDDYPCVIVGGDKKALVFFAITKDHPWWGQNFQGRAVLLPDSGMWWVGFECFGRSCSDVIFGDEIEIFVKQLKLVKKVMS